MKLAAFTSGGISVASSRLRSFYVFKSIVWKEHEVVFNPSFFSINRFQWLHIQKRYSPKFILLVLYARLIGKFVVFDIDDGVRNLDGWVNIKIHHTAIFFMIQLSNKVVTDTILRKKYLIEKYGKKNIIQLSCVLDDRSQDIEKVHLFKYKVNDLMNKGKPVIIWLGNLANFDSFKVLIEADKRFFQFEILVVTDIRNTSLVKLNHPDYTVKQWDLNWLDCLQSSTKYYMLLNHNDSNNMDSIFKSPNKMILAIYNHIIPIVSDTHEYASLAKKLDAEFLIFKTNQHPFDVINSVNKIEGDRLNIFFENSKVYIIEKYSNNIIGANLLKIFQS